MDTIGQVWHPLTDQRYTITLAYCGYSVPMYVCRFCGGRPIAVCRDLPKAEHACSVLAAERDKALGPAAQL